MAETDLDSQQDLNLKRNYGEFRTLVGTLLTIGTAGLTIVALFPLFSVLFMLIIKGGRRLSLEVLTSLPPSPLGGGGGFGNAIVGTVIMVGLACVIAVPIGILGAIYLTEFGKFSKIAPITRFSAKVLSGFPSILAGVFAYGLVIASTGGTFSAYAGAVALSILMVPIILLTAEEALLMVPQKMKEAAVGMGATPFQVAWKVSLPTALPTILTGVMLATARAAGETAPLLFTALFSDYWIRNASDLNSPTASLAVFIFNYSGLPQADLKELAWAASLVLVLFVLVLNVLGQVVFRQKHKI